MKSHESGKTTRGQLAPRAAAQWRRRRRPYLPSRLSGTPIIGADARP